MALPRGWRLAEETIEGGQAFLYQVRREDGSGPFALKRLKNPRRRDRFVREVQTMTRLRAAGVDVVLEVVEADLQDDRPYFVMPWCEETLEDAVTDVRHRLDPEAAVAVLIELVRSVAVPRLKLH